jgi:glycosyltransferase involved in cell wall biosynthesis
MSRKTLSVVLPCYNPDKNWAVNILIRHKELTQLLPGYAINLVMVNDGSTTHVEEGMNYLEANIENLRMISYSPNRGKGYAIRRGIACADGEYIVYTDIDFPYTNKSILKVINGLAESDVTIGTRGSSYYNNIPAHRALISKLLKFLIKTSLRIPTNDTQGGLKGMRQQVKNVFLQTEINRYLFDLEFICLATRNKLKIGLIPVELNENTVVRKMNLKVVSKEMVNFFKVYAKMAFGRGIA